MMRHHQFLSNMREDSFNRIMLFSFCSYARCVMPSTLFWSYLFGLSRRDGLDKRRRKSKGTADTEAGAGPIPTGAS